MKLYKKEPYSFMYGEVMTKGYEDKAATIQDLREAAAEIGFAVVPLEPTKVMIESAQVLDESLWASYTTMYKAMIAAAQQEG